MKSRPLDKGRCRVEVASSFTYLLGHVFVILVSLIVAPHNLGAWGVHQHRLSAATNPSTVDALTALTVSSLAGQSQRQDLNWNLNNAMLPCTAHTEQTWQALYRAETYAWFPSNKFLHPPAFTAPHMDGFPYVSLKNFITDPIVPPLEFTTTTCSQPLAYKAEVSRCSIRRTLK